MKKKLLKSIGIAVLCSAIILGNVLAFSLGTTDGVWGQIDSTGGSTIDADCNAWGKAYASSGNVYNFDVSWPNSVQDDSTTDENQVRYGAPEYNGGCPSTIDEFARQSGFGFAGINDSAFQPAEGQYFPIGRFCHYNNPIYASNDLDTVPLTMTITNIACDTGWTRVDTGDLDFEYRVDLEETTNTDWPCKYGPGDPQWPGGSAYPYVGGGPNGNGCADMVRFTGVANTQKFTCVDNTDSTHTQEYTVSILGFTNSSVGGTCPDTPVGTVSFNQIYTAEETANCYCVYAAFTKGQITPVTLKTMSVTSVDDGILVSWETVTETNNLGFNILRAEAVDGEKVQVNPELIISSGSTFGSAYDYLDETALEGVTYYYWLQDIPLDDSDLPSIHGPISAVR